MNPILAVTLTAHIFSSLWVQWFLLIRLVVVSAIYLPLNLNNRLPPYPNGQILNKSVCCLIVRNPRLSPLSSIHSHAVRFAFLFAFALLEYRYLRVDSYTTIAMFSQAQGHLPRILSL